MFYTNIPGRPPKNFRNIYHPEPEISLYLSNFSKEVSQLTEFRSIWKMCTNVPGMSPKNFRKISNPELEVSLHLSNFSKKVSKLTD